MNLESAEDAEGRRFFLCWWRHHGEPGVHPAGEVVGRAQIQLMRLSPRHLRYLRHLRINPTADFRMTGSRPDAAEKPEPLQRPLPCPSP
jgi:hypothetical protein